MVRRDESARRGRRRCPASPPCSQAAYSVFGRTAAAVRIAADTREVAHTARSRITRTAKCAALRFEVAVRLHVAAGVDLHKRAPWTDRQPQSLRCVVAARIGTERLAVDRKISATARNLPGRCG